LLKDKTARQRDNLWRYSFLGAKLFPEKSLEVFLVQLQQIAAVREKLL
jgi:hypothetical protein